MQYLTEPSHRRFSPMKTALTLTAAALLALAGACTQDDTAGEAIFTPEAFATAALPLSESGQVALLADERVACVIDSYETRIRCVDTEGAVVGVFGREGEGPGEFASPGLVRGEDGTVGVHDTGLGRFTIFEPTGAYVSEVLEPFLDTPLRSFGTLLSGVSVDIMAMLDGGNSGSFVTRYDPRVRRPGVGELSSRAEEVLSEYGRSAARRCQPLLDRHAARHA